MPPKKQLRPLPSLLYLSFFCGYCMPGQSSAAMGQHSAGTEQHPSCIGILTLVVFSSRHESAQIYCTNKQHRRGCGRMLYDCTKPVIVCDMYSYYSCWRLYMMYEYNLIPLTRGSSHQLYPKILAYCTVHSEPCCPLGPPYCTLQTVSLAAPEDYHITQQQ